MIEEKDGICIDSGKVSGVRGSGEGGGEFRVEKVEKYDEGRLSVRGCAREVEGLGSCVGKDLGCEVGVVFKKKGEKGKCSERG